MANELPSGTVTFLFTDVVGSTRLWQRFPGAMRTAMAAHDEIVRNGIVARSGYVFATGGDSFSAAFANPIEAALAALEIQNALTVHEWGELGTLQVRMALDTGLADERSGDYFGPPVNRAARILEHARGDEILASHTTADLIDHEPNGSLRVERTGHHRLRDVDRREALFRVIGAEAGARPRRMRRAVWIAVPAAVAVTAGALIGFSILGDEFAAQPPVATASSAPDSNPVSTIDITWSSPIGIVAAGPFILGDVTVIAEQADIGHRVIAFDAATGTELWDRDDLGTIRTFATDGEYLMVTTRDRVEVLHPTSGQGVPTCGFQLPVALADTEVTEQAIFVLGYGPILRIPTDPGAASCHGPLVGNESFFTGVDPIVGPAASDNWVAAGDAIGVYLFEESTLEEEWRYPESETVLPVSALAVVERALVTRGGGSIESILLVTDASDGTLRSFAPPRRLPLGEVMIDQRFAPVVDSERVLVVDRSGALVAYDLELSEELWRQDELRASTRPVISGQQVIVGDASSRVVAIDVAFGDIVWEEPTKDPITHLAAANGFVHVVQEHRPVTPADIQRTLVSLDVPTENREPWPHPPEVYPLPDPVSVVEAFAQAWSAGNAAEIEARLGVDAKFFALALRELWVSDYRDRLWGWQEHEAILGASWNLSDCTPTPVTRDIFDVRCDSTYTNPIVQAAGIAPLEFETRVEIHNGVITSVVAGETQGAVGRGSLDRLWIVYDSFDDWARAAHGEEYRESCFDDLSAACATFRLRVLDEWADTR